MGSDERFTNCLDHTIIYMPSFTERSVKSSALFNWFPFEPPPHCRASSMATEITLDPAHTWTSIDAQPPTSTEDREVIAPWTAPSPQPPSPPPRRSNFGLASVKVLHRQGSSSNVLTRSRASESTLAESFHSASTGDSSHRDPPVPSTSKGFFKAIKRSLSRPNIHNKYTSDAPPPVPVPAVAFSHDTSSFVSTSALAPPSPPPPPPSKMPQMPRRSHRNKSNASLAPPPRDPEHSLTEPSMVHILNMSLDGVVHPSALEEKSHDSLTSADTTASPLDEFGDNRWTSRFSDDLPAPTPTTAEATARAATPFTNPDPFSTTPASSRRRAIPEPLCGSPKTVLLPVANQAQEPRRLGSCESTQTSDYPASWTAPESWAVPKESDEPEAPDSDDGEEPQATPAPEASFGFTVQLKDGGVQENKAPPRKGSHARSDHQAPPVSAMPPRRISGSHFSQYRIRINRFDGAYHVVSCPLATTVAQLQPVLHRKLLLNRETHRLYLRERGRGAPRLPACTGLALTFCL